MSEALVIVTEDRPVAVQVLEESIALRLGDQVHIDRRTVLVNEPVAAVAGEDLGGHRAVRLGSDGRAYYALQSLEADCLALVGLTTGAAAAGDPVPIRDGGPMEEPSWNWTPDAPVYLAGVGQLSQEPPAAGPVVVMGQAVSPTRMVITLQPRFF